MSVIVKVAILIKSHRASNQNVGLGVGLRISLLAFLFRMRNR